MWGKIGDMIIRESEIVGNNIALWDLMPYRYELFQTIYYKRERERKMTEAYERMEWVVEAMERRMKTQDREIKKLRAKVERIEKKIRSNKK